MSPNAPYATWLDCQKYQYIVWHNQVQAEPAAGPIGEELEVKNHVTKMTRNHVLLLAEGALTIFDIPVGSRNLNACIAVNKPMHPDRASTLGNAS